MTRIEDIDELDLRVELGDDGKIRKFINSRGNDMGVVTAETNDVTGGIELTAGGVSIATSPVIGLERCRQCAERQYDHAFSDQWRSVGNASCRWRNADRLIF